MKPFWWLKLSFFGTKALHIYLDQAMHIYSLGFFSVDQGFAHLLSTRLYYLIFLTKALHIYTLICLFFFCLFLFVIFFTEALLVYSLVCLFLFYFAFDKGFAYLLSCFLGLRHSTVHLLSCFLGRKASGKTCINLADSKT